MSEKNHNILGKILFPPLIFFAGVMTLWENEARFDYASAARESSVIDTPSGAPAGTVISLSGELDTRIPIEGIYVDLFSGYHVVSRLAEIYAWNREDDGDGGVDWSKEWQPGLQNNPRNAGLRQTLASQTLYPPEYRLEELTVDPARIHFVDEYTPIASSGLTLADAGRRAGLYHAGDYFYRSVGGSSAVALGDERVSYRGIRQAPTATYFGLIEDGIAKGKQFPIRGDPALQIGQVRFSLNIQGMIGNDGILHHLVNGDREQALRSMQGHLVKLTWSVRLGGTFAVVLSFFAFFSYFANLLNRIPVIGALASIGALLLSLGIGLPIAFLVILTSRIVHQPWITIVPLALIAVVIVLVRGYSKAAKTNAGQTLERYRSAYAAPNRAGGVSAIPLDPAEASLSALFRMGMLEEGLDDREKMFIYKWAKKNGVSTTRMREFFERAKEGQGEVHARDRNDLVLMACLAMADGSLSARELSVLQAIGKKTGVSEKELRKIIVGVESGTLAPA